MKPKPILIQCILSIVAAFTAAAQTSIPASYAMPAGSVNTGQPGFRVRPYQTDTTHGGTLAWSEEQLAGQHGPNTADLTGADSSGYFTVSNLVNFNIASGGTVDNFPPADSFPGIGAGSTVNFTEEVLTYIEFPAAGNYIMGVNSDDGFGVTASALNPKDGSTAISLGKYDSTRGSGDTFFTVNIAQAGIYPFRLVYFQVGGGANLTWFSVSSDGTSTNAINDLTAAGALKSYATASVAPPYAGGFVFSPAGFSFTITDDISALDPNSLQVTLNGSPVTVTTSKVGAVTTVSYVSSTLFQSRSTNTVVAAFKDNATPAHNLGGTFTFVVPNYTAMPASAALPATAVDTTKRGFLYRVSQIDASTYGVLAANNAHAEAQLAGLLKDPATGTTYPNTTTAGEQPDGSYAITNVNFSFDTASEQGTFTTANGRPDYPFLGVTGADSANLAGEIVTYLDLKAGFYTFAVNATDGFRVTAAANPYDALGVTLGLFDYRAILTETQFGVAVQTAGIYPIRLVFYKVAAANAALELYTIDNQGNKILVNDPTNANAVKAYWKRTAAYEPFVKYAGPSSFVSPFVDSADVGFKTASVIVSDGSTAKVDAATLVWTVDGTAVAGTPTSANGLTTLTYTPSGLQVPREIHSASLSFKETAGGPQHTASWNFHLLRNYVLPTALYSEDFESTAAGPDPTVPAGWVQENYTGHQTAGNDPTDLNSDFYLGWVVVDKSWNISKDFGVSAYSPQELNGTAFVEDTNPLLVNHYMRAETDSRQNGPPGQIQYVTTKAYDLTGKTGIVIAFNSSYEQNQDNINGLEYTVDGTNYMPVFYWVQGDFDGQGPSDVIRDGLGNVDVNKTLMTSYGDVAKYTDPVSQQLVGGYYGFFLKAPITAALAPYVEGRYNDDNSESKRIEVYRVPGADNQKNVKFRFIQAGTSSWYWAIDNWGIYSVPSTVPVRPGNLTVGLSGGKVVISWSGAGTLQSASTVNGTWTDVPGNPSSPYSVTPAAGNQFYRLR